MITFDAFLVFLVAASIPVGYLFIARQIIEGGHPSSKATKREDRSALVSSYNRGAATSH